MAGAGVYTYQLVRALAALQTEHRFFLFARRGLFDDVVRERLRMTHVNPSSPAMRLGWEQTVLPLLLRRLGVDVLHSPHHHTPAVAPGVRRVVTVHDVTFLLLPERYPPIRRVYMQSLTRLSSRLASAIIVPSDAVAEDVVRTLRVPAERVFSIHEAPGPQFGPVDDDALGRVRWKHKLPDRYVLSVGSLEPGKNRARLIRAYARACPEPSCPLIIVGQPAWHYETEYALVRELGLAERVRFLGYVPNDELPALYAGATVFAFPSLYEGFGLPVLEAMACGAPVLTSSVSATAEVAGEAGFLVDPTDEGAIEEGLAQLLGDEGLRRRLRDRGFNRAANFTWDRTARETLDVYEAVAEA